MSVVFSGVWHKNNKILIVKLKQLESLARSEFDIEISQDKMLAETSYRQLVISELSQLGNLDINKITDWLNATNQAETTTPEKKSVTSKPVVLAFSFALLLITVSFFGLVVRTNQLQRKAQL